MKEIPLTKGKVALVDDADYERLSQFKWSCDRGYAVRAGKKCGGKYKKIYMHREIMNTPNGEETDHINLCKTDNRRENLRNCSRSQNQSNSFKYSNNTSGFKGVTWNSQKGMWMAQLMKNRKHIYLGLFENPKDAALAYNAGALLHFGEFAKLNVLEEL